MSLIIIVFYNMNCQFWITYNLLKCIRRKNRLYKKFLRKPTEENKETYRKYRNRLNYALRLAKQNYFSNLLEQEKNNMKNTWKILNSIIRPNSSKKFSEKFVSGNEVYTCPNKTASKFNDYFANIGPKLASTIKHTGQDFSSYLQNGSDTTCFFQPTNENEIQKIINKLWSRKSAGHDNIRADLIKCVASEIAKLLSIIFNASLSSGIFPDELKVAKVVPIYKKDYPQEFGNYRPVSVLPCISKILERIVYNRSYEFLSKNHLLYKKQWFSHWPFNLYGCNRFHKCCYQSHRPKYEHSGYLYGPLKSVRYHRSWHITIKTLSLWF